MKTPHSLEKLHANDSRQTQRYCCCPCRQDCCSGPETAERRKRQDLALDGWKNFLLTFVPTRTFALSVGLFVVVSILGFYDVAAIAGAYMSSTDPDIRNKILAVEFHRHYYTSFVFLLITSEYDYFVDLSRRLRCPRHDFLCKSFPLPVRSMVVYGHLMAFTFIIYPAMRYKTYGMIVPGTPMSFGIAENCNIRMYCTGSTTFTGTLPTALARNIAALGL
ncbi:hypothetical protein EXIGLDRAFT_749903 [Exidia glandulosa HHB12029]|uniref:Uncharacterized protein n=1 Tax=Exidia glandulosa HHB12029 TaxID=1314781 RepID=A0A165HIR1_EXIGL|nr:hypothetical protein EXIGLDRAFT_749903 [Exidia glandulosa HHB12029]